MQNIQENLLTTLKYQNTVLDTEEVICNTPISQLKSHQYGGNKSIRLTTRDSSFQPKKKTRLFKVMLIYYFALKFTWQLRKATGNRKSS